MSTPVRSRQRRRFWRPLGFVFLSIVVAGCGGVAAPTDAPDSSITVLAALYGEFAMQHQGVGPKSEMEFQEFLRGLPEAQRKARGVDQLESLFRSPRDSQPYVVLYGIADVLPTKETKGVLGKPIVVHERSGKDGVSLAANALGGAERFAHDELAHRLPPDSARD